MIERILVVAHGHPSVHKGGAELAAYQLYKEYEKQGFDVKFLARSEETEHGGAAFSSRHSDKELLFHTTHDDFFLFSNLKSRYVWQEFRDLLLRFNPDVVHFHHYFLIGIETIMEVRNTLPNCRIILTLHEYLAICHNKGLMVKTNENRLCYQATPKDCHLCFPDNSTADFFMREQYLKRIFSVVDHFISPSEFLRKRYIDWGIADSKISVVENGQAIPIQPEYTEVKSENRDVLRLGFFGQINQYKGVDLLLEAYAMLPKPIRRQCILEIHGANLDVQPKDFRSKISKLLKANKGNVNMHGAYEPSELTRLMSDIDWLIVPSIWWENSPMVIQEAFSHNVPVIASDIGGMAEKVVNGKNGLTFRAGKATALMASIQQVVEEKLQYSDYVNNINMPITIEQSAAKNLEIYQQCR